MALVDTNTTFSSVIPSLSHRCHPKCCDSYLTFTTSHTWPFSFCNDSPLFSFFLKDFSLLSTCNTSFCLQFCTSFPLFFHTRLHHHSPTTSSMPPVHISIPISPSPSTLRVCGCLLLWYAERGALAQQSAFFIRLQLLKHVTSQKIKNKSNPKLPNLCPSLSSILCFHTQPTIPALLSCAVWWWVVLLQCELPLSAVCADRFH